jgi:nicotinamidase-related amidase
MPTLASPVLANAADVTLVLIDFQPKLMLACRTLEPQVLTGNAVALAKVGAAFNLPVVTTGGRADDPFLTEVSDAAGPNKTHIDRRTIDAFETPEFVQAIEEMGRRTLVMAGITTDLCVLFPAISAIARGFTVQVVVDASACFTRQIEDVALMRLQQAGVALTTWASFASELHRGSNWQTGPGPTLMRTFVEHHAGMHLMGAMPRSS